MTCELCRDEQEGGYRARCPGIEIVDECPIGEVPKLARENRGFWILFERIFPGLIDGSGGFDFRAIETVFNFYGVPESQRPIIHDKCLIMIKAIEEIREQKRQHAREAKT